MQKNTKLMKKLLALLFTTYMFSSCAWAQDREITAELSRQLAAGSAETGLHFPSAVKRLYAGNGSQPIWIKPQADMGKTWQAMLLIDCVLQFGLAHADYHPYELSYDTLHTLLEKPGELGPEVAARFDIVLSDALITFINHLHYGKFNPEFTPERIDSGRNLPFHADRFLMEAYKQQDLMPVITSVQPKTKAYQDLQGYMRLVKGQYTSDCYEVPEADVRLAAINMERLRWENFGPEPYLHINIPSYTLELHEPDSIYAFKVIVGIRDHPTPVLSSAIGYFTTAPDWNVPHRIFIRELLPKALADTRYFETHNYSLYNRNGEYVPVNSLVIKDIKRNPSLYQLRQSSGCDNALGQVVFRFPNQFDVYLHDSPEQKLFDRRIRSLSHGCIRVQKAVTLAELLLKYDGASDQIPLMHRNVKRYLRSDFRLRKPVPIRVTYLTCSIEEGQLVRYKDIYQLDRKLEASLYNLTDQLAAN